MIPLTAIALLSVGLFSGLDAILGYLTNILEIPVYESICMRMGLVFLLALGYVLRTGTPDAPLGPPPVRHLMWIRGGLLTMGLITGYTSLRYLTISEFLTIFCCLPFPTGLLCWISLDEKFTRVQMICCCFSILGVAMITDPFGRWGVNDPMTDDQLVRRAIEDNIPNDLTSKLIGLAICAPNVLALAGEMTIMRVIKDQASTMQIMVYISFCPAVISAMIMAGTQTPIVYPNSIFGWFLLFIIAPLGLGAQYTLTYASQGLQGVHLTICSSTGIIFATVIQWLIYGNHPSIVAFAGMAVISAEGLCSVIYGPASKDEEEDKLEARTDIEMPLMAESRER